MLIEGLKDGKVESSADEAESHVHRNRLHLGQKVEELEEFQVRQFADEEGPKCGRDTCAHDGLCNPDLGNHALHDISCRDLCTKSPWANRAQVNGSYFIASIWPSKHD